MPEIQIQDRLASELKEGWTLFDEKIVEVKIGRKNVYVRLEKPVAGKSLYPFTVSDKLEAGVWVPTAEELEEKHQEGLKMERDYLVDWIDRQVQSVDGSLEKAIAGLDPQWLRYDPLDAIIYADAYQRIYARMGAFMEKAREQKLHKEHVDGGECEYTEPSESGHGMRCVKPTVPTTAYDGAQYCVRWIADEIASKAMGFRASSRSTSMMSNYLEDVYLEALAKVARDMRYAVGSELRDVLPKGW